MSDYPKTRFILIVIVVYIALSGTIFAFRHPWMTDTERFLNIHHALMFHKVEKK